MKDALALALVHFLWQGALLAFVAAVLMRLVHGSAQARYAIGVATLCAMVAAPAVTAAWLIQAEPVTVVPDQSVATPAPDTLTTVTRGQGVVSGAATVTEQASAPVFPYATAVLAGWALGVMLLSGRLAGGWLIAHRLATRAVRPVVDELQQVARRLAVQLRLSRPVRILESASVAVPVMVGWLKPVVLLPAAAIAGLPAEHLEALLAHELAHVRRHDYLINLLQSTAETLLFYHPGVWWVSNQVRVEREHCCDDLAVSVTERVTYVTALTHVASLTAPGLALAATDGSLRGRVRRLLGPERDRPSGGVWLAALPVVLVIAVATPMSGTTEEVARLGSQLEAAIQSAQDSQAPSAIGEATDVHAVPPPEAGAAKTPERITEQAASESSPSKPGTIAPGDRLRIQFHGIPLEDQGMSGDYQVSSSGTVNMKYLNDLTVGGLTATQAQAAIQSSLEEQGFYTQGAVRLQVTILAGTGAPPASGALPMGPQAEQRGAAGEKGSLDDLRSLLAADRGTHDQLTTQQSAIRVQLEVQRGNTARVQDLAAKGLATADAVSRAEREEAALAGTVMVLEQQLMAVQARIATYQGKIDSLVGSGPASDQKAPAQVKPGETIVINVEGRPELSGEYVVQPDGTIKLKGVQAEVIQVQVNGAVRSPGVIRLQGGDRRLSRAIAEVGGFAMNAGHEIEVIRRGPGRGLSGFRVTRAQLDANDDTSLQDGDRVNVKIARVFFVNGEVKRQGEKRWEPGMTVGKALALAGGAATSFSLDQSRIDRPIKDEAGRVVQYERIVDLTLETLILPDDVLVASRKPM